MNYRQKLKIYWRKYDKSVKKAMNIGLDAECSFDDVVRFC
jgi:hypothetical protein